MSAGFVALRDHCVLLEPRRLAGRIGLRRAAASAGEDTPAIGAWTIGSSIPSCSSKLMRDKHACAVTPSI